MSDKKDISNVEIKKMANSEAIITLHENADFIFVCKKAEKICTAIHLVTNLFPTTEPIRHKLRENSIVFLDHVRLLKENIEFGRHIFFEKFKATLASLISLFKVAHESGLVSGMNFSVIMTEIDNVSSLIYERFIDGGVDISGHADIPHDFFGIETSQNITGNGQKNAVVKPFIAISKNERLTEHSGVVEDKKDDRRSIILDLARKNAEITVKDVASVIKNYSEKTLQRELLSMVSEGVLKRSGERRWSRYSLA
ncbi:hypothetical protein KW783_01715 [Candidatus Parcubacteria bacterium]|nr:hypothetical protein [Candidatus Parcubacteria bacterium]